MPSQEVAASIIVGNWELTEPTNISVKRSTGPEADMGTATTLSDDPLDSRSTALVYINGVRQATGTFHSSDIRGDGAYNIEFYDAMRTLRQSTITASFSSADVREVIRDIIAPAGVVTVEIDLSPLVLTDVDAAVSIGDPRFLITEEFTNVPCTRALDKVTREVGWYWYVDHHNTVQVISEFDYDMMPDDIPRLGRSSKQLPTGRNFRIHELEYILDSSPGALTPRYEKVVVTGGASEPDRGHMISKNPVEATATAKSYTTGDPVYQYQDDTLTTQENAQAAADKILNRLLSQQTGGWVETVGNPYVRPYDIIMMPSDMGGTRYMVTNVQHSVDGKDGFTTRFGCGGLDVSGGDSDTSPVPYAATYSENSLRAGRSRQSIPSDS